MLKKIKWVLLGLVAIAIIIGAYVVSLVRYAETEATDLDNYVTSISAMSEVVSVQSIHRFNGLESYIVARIEHESGQDLYFFVRDGNVQYLFIASELINDVDANTIAHSLVQNGEIISTQLGILEGVAISEDQTEDDEDQGIPIFEVQIEDEDEDVVHYIVINAWTSEVIMNFDVE